MKLEPSIMPHVIHKDGTLHPAAPLPSSWLGILKCQRPLGANVDAPPCLFYNEERSVQFDQVLSAMDMRLVFPYGARKTYWRAEIHEGVLRFDAHVAEQPW